MVTWKTLASRCGIIYWAVLSDEQMSNGYPFSLLNDEQMSNKVGVEHQPVYFGLQPPEISAWWCLMVSIWKYFISRRFSYLLYGPKKNQPTRRTQPSRGRWNDAFQLTQPTFLAPKGLEPLQARPGTKHQQEFAGSWWCPGAWEESSCGCLNKMRCFLFFVKLGQVFFSSCSFFFWGGKGFHSFYQKVERYDFPGNPIWDLWSIPGGYIYICDI